MMEQNEAKARPVRPWVRILLIGSLALNLLFIGLMGGMALRFGGMDKRPPPSVGAALYRALPDTERRSLRQELRRTRDHRDLRAGHRQEILAVAEVLRAEPFEVASLEALVSAQLLDRHGGLEEARAVWISQIVNMSSAARQDYADRLIAVMDAPRKKSRRWFGRDREGGN